MEQKTAVIIGGGPAGLTAACELLREDGYAVTVLEESGVLGGISRTVQYHGNRMDIGGHRFFSREDAVMDWWRELMPLQGAPALDDRILGREKPLSPGGPDPERDEAVMLIRDRVSRIYYQNAFFDYPVTLNGNTLRGMGLWTAVRAGCSYLAACARKLPEENLENFYINRFGRILYEMFFEGYTEKLWGRHPREISADWGAQRVKGLSVLAVLRDMAAKGLGRKDNARAETSLIEQFWYPKYGPGQLWELAGARVRERGGDILFHHRVTAVRTEGNRVAAVVCDTPEGVRTVSGDVFLSSMPVKDLVLGMESVPSSVRAVAAGLPYRDFVTVGLLLDRLELKNTTKRKTLGGIVPDCWIYVQDRGVKLGRLQIFNNWSPYMVERPMETVWIGLEYFCAEGDAFWNLSDGDCAAFAAEELCRMGVIRAGAVLESHVERVKKAYPAYFDTYSRFEEVREFLDGFSNLWCIGRNGQHRYNNMDHSMLTAMEAVRAIREGRTEKSAVWQVNTERTYHEKK